jgi:hypothetical protein
MDELLSVNDPAQERLDRHEECMADHDSRLQMLESQAPQKRQRLSHCSSDRGLLCGNELRRQLWSALGNDDAGALVQVITESQGKRSLHEHLECLELEAWHDGAGKHGKERAGLVVISSTQLKGIPAGGAVKCLDALLKLHGPGPVHQKAQLELSLGQAKSRFGESRAKVVQLLEAALTRL